MQYSKLGTSSSNKSIVDPHVESYSSRLIQKYPLGSSISRNQMRENYTKLNYQPPTLAAPLIGREQVYNRSNMRQASHSQNNFTFDTLTQNTWMKKGRHTKKKFPINSWV